MPQQLKIHNPNAIIRCFAATSLLPQLAALAAEIPGVRAAEDIECIHRMRVASRRLRTRLLLFADFLPARRLRAWRKGTRRITQALGAARDLDVQLAFLLDFLDALSDQTARPGVEAVLHCLGADRADRQSQVIDALDQLEHSEMLADLHDFLAGHFAPEMAGGSVTPPPALHHLIETTITEQLADLIHYEVYLAFPERTAEHHAMRIAAKHLRYTLETYAPLLGEGIKPTLKIMRALQDMLGDVHDCDVWATLLTGDQVLRFIPPHASAIPVELLHGFDVLLADRRAFRVKRFAELLDLWQQQQREQRWYALLREIRGSHDTGDGGHVGSGSEA